MKITQTKIEQSRQLLSNILGEFALKWDAENAQVSFEIATKAYFGFEDEFAWNILLNALYVIDDTEMAKVSFRMIQFKEFSSYDKVGNRYLTLYGFLNACYQQKIAMENLIEIFKIAEKKNLRLQLGSTKMIELRNKIGAHPSNHRNSKKTRTKFDVYEISRSELSWGKIRLLKN